MLLFLQNSTQIPPRETLIIIYVCLFLKLFFYFIYYLGTKEQLKTGFKWSKLYRVAQSESTLQIEFGKLHRHPTNLRNARPMHTSYTLFKRKSLNNQCPIKWLGFTRTNFIELPLKPDELHKYIKFKGGFTGLSMLY